MLAPPHSLRTPGLASDYRRRSACFLAGSRPSAGHMNIQDLPPFLAEALAARGYAAPTPVQAAVLEPEAEGRDLIVSAQTGSGKTVAFGLAMAAQLLDENGRCRHAGRPLALIDRADARTGAAGQPRADLALRQGRGARIATCVGGMDASQGAPRAQRTARISSSARRAACATISSAARSICRAQASRCSTRPTRCSTWASARISSRSSTPRPTRRRTLLFSATMPQADRRARQALPARRAAHLDRRRGSRPWRHRLSGGDGRARRTSRMRWSTCCASTSPRRRCCSARRATRAPPPRQPGRARLRRGGAVGRAQPDRAQRTRCRRCATGARGSASRPTSPRAASTCRRSASSSMSSCRAMPRRSSTARAAPAAPGKQGHRGADRALSSAAAASR